MKQSLQLKMGQSLALTPQLQQAIKLLQLSTLDLQQAIEETLESNPLLEREEEGEAQSENQDSQSDVDFTAATAEVNSSDELPVDTRWEDLMPSSAPPLSSPDGEMGQFADRDAEPETLHDQLHWQLNLTRFSATDHMIATAFIDAVDANGRLTQTPEEILEALRDPELELDEVLAVLHRLQHFEPTGIFASDLRECLLLQLRQMDEETPHRNTAGAIANRHLESIATADPRQLSRRLRTTPEDVVGALNLIRSLDPTPGTSVGESTTEYIIPDVFVMRKEGHWRVELNPDVAPKLRINALYSELVGQSGSASDKTFVRENLQEAKFFMTSLHNRNETLLKVASKIVAHQREFLELGEEAMKPLILADIAEQINMHESTVSRATTRKYMHTPRGIYELKFFFSSHVATTEGGERSSTAIKALIKKLVQAEDAKKPLSDNKLCVLLEEQGVIVARRTVAKYREQLNISPSNERRRLL
ncbi:RNA polymerase factor sigma-54 [Draconibacterium sp.]|nr:RNA polymerase factor sigma-54 [Luminiphilus sp.]MDA8772983.1 RNA polymerase factor sigma-54 [Luminiphilus sp.]MDA8826565.1 RNA polymerase factor sigma-54 [Luminiphilus sp.]MDA9580051.1 RNA polymerase factor sigma-54 [Luminiphilus sp.]MDB4581794.1 RNA polymerase factor sigma-54 [Draconibacterium sp.]